MSWSQQTLTLRPRARGMHLITDELQHGVRALHRYQIGMANLFLQHTSASLCINENADPSVRVDLEGYLTRAVPDGSPQFTHDAEGDDDMPAHVKNALLGCSLSIPIRQGVLALGTWQGVWLCEHRAHAGARTLVATLWGQEQTPL